MIGYGHPGSSDYDEIQAVLHRFFQKDAGKDYKVIAFQGQPSGSRHWSMTISRPPD